MLLHSRSIVLEVCLILIATKCATSQEYDYSAEDGDYSSENTEDGYSQPDYTTYFSSKPIINPESAPNAPYNGGLPNEAEFASFFHTPLEFSEPNSKASTAPQTFAPQKAQKADPFEALRQSFNQKEEASETDPLQKDYFEESLKQQQKDEEDDGSLVHPGPHYVSHQLPIPALFNTEDEDRAQSKDDVETIPPPLKGKHNTKKVKVDPARPGYDGFKDSFDAFELLRKTEEQIEQTKVDPASTYSAKNVDYNTGKSSAISQAYPAASGYLASLKVPTTTVSSYEKYGYQPDASNYEALQSKYLGSYASTATPLKHTEKAALNSNDDGLVEPSNNVPESLKNKGCRKISSPENSEGMSCFVCEDSANKAKYTQCSYTSADEPVNAYAGSSLRYSSPVKAPASLRYKRSPAEDYSVDPYFRVSENSKRYFDDFEKEQKAAESKREKEFHYSPYEPEDYDSYSETQSTELLKEPGACHKIEREGMTCTVCKNPKTGGNFEQCSYTSAPKEQKYAYVAEKKYDSEDDAPEETKTIIKQSSEEPQKGESSSIVPASTLAPVSEFTTATKSKIVRDVIPELTAAGSSIDETTEESPETDEESDDEESEDDKESDDKESDDKESDDKESDDKESVESDDEEDKKEEKESTDDGPSYLFNYDELKKEKKLVDDDPYYVPQHFSEGIDDKKTVQEPEAEDESFDEYHYKLFPVFQNEAESKTQEQTSNPEGEQQDVEEVLAEFAKKDRSNCKKAEKNGMTCFLCVDKNKVQHEECMYIAESKPKATHVAFHEVQRLKDPKDEPAEEESDGEESKVESLTQQPLDTALPLASEISKRKKFFKKVITTPLPLANLELDVAASDVYQTVVPFEAPKKRYTRKTRKDSKASGSAPDSERLEDEKSQKQVSEEPEAPKEINVGDEEGAYSYETKPVYSKRFGTTLPKYMVEKTEFEKEFDDAAGFD